jgi:hypothetical protein
MRFRLTAIAVLLAAFGSLVELTPDREEDRSPVPMEAEDGATYLVEPDESLGTAMCREKKHASRAPQSEEQGACVPEPMEDKPAGAVSCRCYEQTHCKGNESHQCKRHCRKDLCQCCDI